ncbi:hypothetical protein BD310DRAFT_940315 [Dichomitus squalens]|uniref:Uncharacterized protein n=1 Tax=Dichomitus squalens TaxID=114155 RepID=A0A4Q9PCF0_9APHY|nr:hypothetical protein BD310DRAFT_940315 [Dichomitus squalens]
MIILFRCAASHHSSRPSQSPAQRLLRTASETLRWAGHRIRLSADIVSLLLFVFDHCHRWRWSSQRRLEAAQPCGREERRKGDGGGGECDGNVTEMRRRQGLCGPSSLSTACSKVFAEGHLSGAYMEIALRCL